LKKWFKTIKETLRDGFLNGRGRVIKRRVKREQAKLKGWLRLVNKKQRMCLQLGRAQVVNRLLRTLRKKENDH
jgi:hypothetical protein